MSGLSPDFLSGHFLNLLIIAGSGGALSVFLPDLTWSPAGPVPPGGRPPAGEPEAPGPFQPPGPSSGPGRPAGSSPLPTAGWNALRGVQGDSRRRCLKPSLTGRHTARWQSSGGPRPGTGETSRGCGGPWSAGVAGHLPSCHFADAVCDRQKTRRRSCPRRPCWQPRAGATFLSFC